MWHQIEPRFGATFVASAHLFGADDQGRMALVAPALLGGSATESVIQAAAAWRGRELQPVMLSRTKNPAEAGLLVVQSDW